MAERDLPTTPAATPGHPQRWRVLFVVCLVLQIVVIDMTVLHVASPSIAADLRPTAVQLLWIVDIYSLVIAPLLVLSATLGDRFGRKRVLLTGLAIFAAASLLAAFAWSAEALIGARVLQGIGGAAIAPATMAIIRDVFPDRDERAKAIGIWSATMAFGAAAGPILGGLLIEAWWWGAVFLINVPVLALTLPVAMRLLPESRSSDPPRWDPLSVAIVAAGVLLLAWGIKHGARYGFDHPEPLLALGSAAALLTWFTRRQLALENPTLDVRLFGSRLFRVAVVCVALSVFAIVGLELIFAQYLQLVAGFGPAQASLWMAPLLLSTMAGAFLGPRALTAIGPRRTIAGGFLLSAASLVPMLWLGEEPQLLLLMPAFVVLGAALEAALIGANDMIFASVDVDRAGQASAIEETAYEFGGGIGVAVLGSILGAVSLAQLGPEVGEAIERAGVSGAVDAGTAGAGAGPGAGAAVGELVARVRESLPEALLVADELGGAAGRAVEQFARDAFMQGFHAALVVSIVLTAAAGLVAALRIGEGRDGRGGDAVPEHE